ncbi:hypothetical protein OF83DRAFT_651632 [Amylostereum chailletii]|nr:hypothetical protein OF83DRAFT_651632 [Amylostereum chailletii]
MTPQLPQMNALNRDVLATVLGRPEPDAEEAERMQAEYDASPLKERLTEVVATNHPWPDPHSQSKNSILEEFQSVQALRAAGEPATVSNTDSVPPFSTSAALGLFNPHLAPVVGFSVAREVLGPAFPPRVNSQPELPPAMHVTHEAYATDIELRTQDTAFDDTPMETKDVPGASSSKQLAAPAPQKEQALSPNLENTPVGLSAHAFPSSSTKSQSSAILLPNPSYLLSASSRRSEKQPSTSSTSSTIKYTQDYSLPASSPGPSTSTNSQKVASVKAAERASKSQPVSAPLKTPSTSVTTPVSTSTVRPAASTGGKRRLGMGRPTMGYPNKKFKPQGT